MQFPTALHIYTSQILDHGMELDGAGLVFTSSTREINCGLLQHYLLRLMYPHLLKRPLPKPKVSQRGDM